jgi:hypothetical protein
LRLQTFDGWNVHQSKECEGSANSKYMAPTYGHKLNDSTRPTLATAIADIAALAQSLQLEAARMIWRIQMVIRFLGIPQLAKPGCFHEF